MSLPTTSSMPQTTIDAQKRKRQLFLNWISAALVALVVIAAFHKTVFNGAAISRVYQLGQRDTLFIKYFAPQREGYDASVYQYFVPSHIFLTEQLRHGIIPLWNPLAGCGAPFLADVETAALWPYRLALLCLPPLRSWNLLIVANILNFALGTFLLARALNLRRFAIIYASLTCAFCPYLIFQSELIGSSASMIPLVMASFVYAQSSGKFLAKGLAGLACGIMIVSGHPEPSFFGIACASTLYVLLSVFDKEGGRSLLRRSLFSLLDIGIIGAFAFSFSAFMLLPLFELLRNSDCYKLGLTGHRDGVPLNSILINLIHPAYGNSSAFLGILAVPLIICALWYGFRSDRHIRALSICSLLFLAVMSQIGPLDWLMNSKAFSWFVPKYCWPSLLIMLTILSAAGFQYLTTDMQKNWRKAVLCVTAGSLLTIIALATIQLAPALLEAARQDEAFDHMQIIGKYFSRDIILLTVFSIVVAASRFFGNAQAASCVLAVTACTIMTLAPLAKQASPAGRSFNYDRVEPIPFLEQHNERMITMGRHVFCPSSNFCYGINNFVPVNVYHPLRFQNFLIACGVTPEGVNQFFDGRLGTLADLASVKYVVTPQPVLGESETIAEAVSLKSGKTIGWGEQNELQLLAAGLSLHPKNRELLGTLRFQVPAARARELAVQAVLLDDKKNVLWLGDADRLLYLFDNTPQDKNSLTLTKALCVPLPPVSGKLSLSLKAFDWKQMKYLPRAKGRTVAGTELKQAAQSGKEKTGGESARIQNSSGQALMESEQKIEIAICDPAKASLESQVIESCGVASSERRFKLCQETSSHVRVYENTRALPQAYLRYHCQVAQDANSSLNLLKAASFNAANQVVIEPLAPESHAEKEALDSMQKPADRNDIHRDEKLVFRRINCNKISVDIETKDKALLVLTETFYPGWQATIEHDNKLASADIIRANYLFQSVLVPEGKSTVSFEFKPAGFTIGLFLFALASITALAGAVWHFALIGFPGKQKESLP